MSPTLVPPTLLNPTLVITRPRVRAERFAGICREVIGRDIPVLIAPVVEIQQLPLPKELSKYRGVIVTSESGLQSLSWPEGAVRPVIWAVGAHTADRARAMGFEAVDGGGTAKALVRTIVQANPEGPLLHLHGSETRGRVRDRLAEAGLRVDGFISYRQQDVEPIPAAVEVLRRTTPVILPVFSVRSAERLLNFGPSRTHQIVAISHAVAKTWPDGRHPVLVAKRPTAISMAHCVAALYEEG